MASRGHTAEAMSPSGVTPLVVVDTDVVSFLFKGDTRAEGFLPHLADKTAIISFMTLAELDRWMLERGWGANRKQQLEAYLRDYVVYGYDRALCQRWAEVTFLARRAGRPIQTADAWIAATALSV